MSYVQAGDSLRLACQAQSTPAPTLRWYKVSAGASAGRPADRSINQSFDCSSSSSNNSNSLHTKTKTTTWPINAQNKVPLDSDSGPFRLLGGPQPTDSGEPRVQSQPQPQQQGRVQLDLFIDNIQAGQTTGDYVCLASNSEGSVEARAQVALAVPAVITTMPRNQTRLEGERAELLCQAKALPSNITYKWLFNGKPLQQLKRFESRFTIKQRDGTLVLHSLHRDDQGEFKCQATNGLAHRWRQSTGGGGGGGGGANTELATQKSGPIKLAPIYAEAAAHLEVEFPARVTYSPPVQYLPLGLSGQIRCHVQASPAVEFFTWTLNNQQFDPNADPNVERQANGSLLIKQVAKHYEGKYRCTPFNKHGSAGSSNAMEVRVEQPPQFELKPADFYKVNLNGALKLPCEARGSPKPSVSWRKVTTSTSTSSSSNSPPSLAGKTRRQLKRLAGQRRLSKRRPSDEAADEPDPSAHLFYGPLSPEVGSQKHSKVGGGVRDDEEEEEGEGEESGGEHRTPASKLDDDPRAQVAVPAQLIGSSENNNSGGGGGGEDADHDDNQAGQHQEQPTVIVSYSKLPSDRSELKQAHLVLHSLKKEDHGRYECVIENEVATLVASTMVYIEETTPHAPSDLRAQPKAWSVRLTWSPGYDGGFEQSFVVWYRQTELRPSTAGATSGPGSTTELSYMSATTTTTTTTSGQQPDVNWHSANVQPSDATSFTVQNLSQDTVYEFYVRSKNIIGDGPRSQIIRASTKRALAGSVTPLSVGSGETLAATGADSDPVAAASGAPGSAQGKLNLSLSLNYFQNNLWPLFSSLSLGQLKNTFETTTFIARNRRTSAHSDAAVFWPLGRLGRKFCSRLRAKPLGSGQLDEQHSALSDYSSRNCAILHRLVLVGGQRPTPTATCGRRADGRRI